VAELLSQGKKIAAPNLQAYRQAEAVARALAWSDEVNARVAQLNEIGLTPGIRESIFEPFKGTCDFYVVSTAVGHTLPPLMEKEGIDFILRYLGQETATKTESLLALARSGYNMVFMFGDSLEDTRATSQAQPHIPQNVSLLFVPVLPGEEKRCFATGQEVIEQARAGHLAKAEIMCGKLAQEFNGKEVGTQTG
jgi:hypothetical protein